MKNYDVAAFIWPAFSGDDPRSRVLWSEGYGEWQTLKNSAPKFPGHRWPRRPLWGYVNEGDPYVMEMEKLFSKIIILNIFKIYHIFINLKFNDYRNHTYMSGRE